MLDYQIYNYYYCWIINYYQIVIIIISYCHYYDIENVGFVEIYRIYSYIRCKNY